MTNDNIPDDNVVAFKPKTLKDNKQKIYGTIELTDDGKVAITMQDKVMLLEGRTAFDFGLLIMCAAKVLLTGETINVHEVE